MDYRVNLHLKLNNEPGKLAEVLEAVAGEGGNLGAIDLVSSMPGYNIRDLMVYLKRDYLDNLIQSLERIPGVEVIQVADRVFLKHLGGKIEISSKREIRDNDDLSLVYTPGVAGVSETIHKHPDMAYRLTMKGNTVAIVSDGSAVLGLGDVGPRAALPVMEGKALLFKKFAGVDAFPLCLDTRAPEDIINVVAAAAPSFGGINLEDISAPKCFEIEEKLREKLDIPVFHDDQHGTAVVTTAGLINALKVVNKRLTNVKTVVSGAGAAGAAITKMLVKAGVREIIVCDRKGAVNRNRSSLTGMKKWLAENTNANNVQGTLKEVIKGADVFIGVSGPGLLNREDIRNMAENPVVFALANPVPEINPREIYDVVGTAATGRSDYPNQVNNVLAFPGIFRGALDCHARTINEEMCMAASRALADNVTKEQLSPDYIIPTVFNDKVFSSTAAAVKEAAKNTGVSRKYSYELSSRGRMFFY
ncbi:MAG: NAD-dependent malic enzyme [Clostridiales bacterium]|nr:NAD-dependent malic enzyme [Clostridiales bacterium]MCF8023093.1 NAD-dependent malic enzyme [Clostridiales bacterium]